MVNNIKGIQSTLQLTGEWINDLMMSYPFQDQHKAFVLLMATLKTVRDRIVPEEAMHLGSQLPALIRGFYYDGWDFKRKSKDRSVDQFYLSVQKHLNGHDDIVLEETVPIALKVILNRIDEGEAEEVVHNLPKRIQEICV